MLPSQRVTTQRIRRRKCHALTVGSFPVLSFSACFTKAVAVLGEAGGRPTKVLISWSQGCKRLVQGFGGQMARASTGPLTTQWEDSAFPPRTGGGGLRGTLPNRQVSKSQRRAGLDADRRLSRWADESEPAKKKRHRKHGLPCEYSDTAAKGEGRAQSSSI
ncbi:hypothetical protein B0T25DRAFT_307259 [Lasiosphaeria hispida]|uniref:Uncharacterized protein n=1 Tax=Lasiosphaeria hispida TaxID=260671 RepID=A0AAJ0H9B0_9PEZI|nr:hypothetical protein B0T25DRAFT_307259 [Lasiosphaeria hispida]